jgi:regulator of protease activity HflC (stomatin/prohibitin superfamily)
LDSTGALRYSFGERRHRRSDGPVGVAEGRSSVAGLDFSELFRRYKEALGQAQSSQGKTVPGGGSMAPKSRLIKIAAIAIVVFLIFSGSLVIIGPGQRGVVINFGAVSPQVWDEGLHFKIPVYQRIEKMDVRVQKEQTEAAAASKDLQDTHSTIAVNFNILPDKAGWVFQHIGRGYNERVIDPVTQEVVKAVTARYTAVELITNREKIRTEIKELLKARLLDYHIAVVDVSIVNFKFSAQFTQAIENKQTAEQMALKASRDLDRIKIEAQQKIAAAQAEAESLRLQRQNITAELVELRRIEAMQEAIKKWNGVLPQVTGGAMPFIDAKSYTGK